MSGICGYCGRPYEQDRAPRGSERKYCSDLCRHRAYKGRQERRLLKVIIQEPPPWPVWWVIILILFVVGIFVAALLMGCSFSPTSPTESPSPAGYECSLSPGICEAWEAAKVEILCIGKHSELLLKSKVAEQIVWEAIPGPIVCGDNDPVTVAGCFFPDRLHIAYNPTIPDQPWLLRHEAGHAILHLLGDRHMHCFEHEGEAECPSIYWQLCGGLRLAPTGYCDAIVGPAS